MLCSSGGFPEFALPCSMERLRSEQVRAAMAEYDVICRFLRKSSIILGEVSILRVELASHLDLPGALI